MSLAHESIFSRYLFFFLILFSFYFGTLSEKKTAFFFLSVFTSPALSGFQILRDFCLNRKYDIASISLKKKWEKDQDSFYLFIFFKEQEKKPPPGDVGSIICCQYLTRILSQCEIFYCILSMNLTRFTGFHWFSSHGGVELFPYILHVSFIVHWLFTIMILRLGILSKMNFKSFQFQYNFSC